jgi:hypothetical protein
MTRRIASVAASRPGGDEMPDQEAAARHRVLVEMSPLFRTSARRTACTLA